MSQTKRDRPAANETATQLNTITCRQGNPTTATLPIARAMVLPATGRRRLDAAVVTRCPWCRRSHLHRGLRLNGAVRGSGCSPAREYVLVVVA